MLNRLFQFFTFVVFYTLTITVHAGSYPTQLVKNGFARGADPKVLPITVLTSAKASELFRDLKSRDDIPYAFSQTGCESRAMAMTEVAGAQGITMGHVFAEGDLVAKSNQPGRPDRWPYHVAAIVYVAQPKGPAQMRVIDPSLFDRPVTIEEWKKRITFSPLKNYRAEVSKLYFGSRYQLLPRFGDGDVGTRMHLDAKDRERYRTTNANGLKFIKRPGTVPLNLRRQSFTTQSIE